MTPHTSRGRPRLTGIRKHANAPAYFFGPGRGRNRSSVVGVGASSRTHLHGSAKGQRAQCRIMTRDGRSTHFHAPLVEHPVQIPPLRAAPPWMVQPHKAGCKHRRHTATTYIEPMHGQQLRRPGWRRGSGHPDLASVERWASSLKGRCFWRDVGVQHMKQVCTAQRAACVSQKHRSTRKRIGRCTVSSQGRGSSILSLRKGGAQFGSIEARFDLSLDRHFTTIAPRRIAPSQDSVDLIAGGDSLEVSCSFALKSARAIECRWVCYAFSYPLVKCSCIIAHPR